jgi:glycosyltransferase involved in cell wall biosynthesis
VRVAIITPSFGVLGGIQTFVFALAEELHAQPAIDVTVAFKRVSGTTLEESLSATATRSPVRTVFVERASAALVRTIRAADLVHVQTPSLDVVALATLLRKPVVMTIHNWRPPTSSLRSRLKGLAAALAARRLYNSDYVWASWEGDRRSPTSAKLPIVSSLPEGVVPPEQRRGFAFVARLVAGKGADVLVDAYADARLDPVRWPLTIMGEGPLRAQIEETVLRRGLRGIEVTGFVARERRDEVIRGAKWLVAPPHIGEDLGLTPIEARNVGVPCILTRDGGLPEAGGRESLYCEPADRAGLRDLLVRAAGMDEREYARRARATREELAAYLRPLSVYVSLYREVLAGGC